MEQYGKERCIDIDIDDLDRVEGVDIDIIKGGPRQGIRDIINMANI